MEACLRRNDEVAVEENRALVGSADLVEALDQQELVAVGDIASCDDKTLVSFGGRAQGGADERARVLVPDTGACSNDIFGQERLPGSGTSSEKRGAADVNHWSELLFPEPSVTCTITRPLAHGRTW